MKCPACKYNGTRVVDSRPVDDRNSIRRRRECEKCNFRFTTFEKIEESPLIVVKKDGSREEFACEKIQRGLIRACEKRTIGIEQIEGVVNEIESEFRSTDEREISSELIGEKVMDKLAQIDEVAYVRFASVYRQFRGIEVFIEKLNELKEKKKKM